MVAFAQTLARLLQPDCAFCGLPRLPSAPLCAGCYADLPWLAHQDNQPLPHTLATLSAFAYQPPISSLLLQLKFGKNLRTLATLGELTAQGILPQIPAVPEALLPVPLHVSRLRERGFNQAVELARPLATRLHIPLILHEVRRSKATQRQTELSAEQRQDNVQHAFQIHRPLRYRHIALVDDVITTGATVSALVQLLLAQGVEQVQVWSCARAVQRQTATDYTSSH